MEKTTCPVSAAFNSILEPFIEDIEDPTAIYIGIIVFGAALTVLVILLLRLDWARILGKVAPWTLYDDENNPDS
ncbi:MAG: hypothetical protein JKY22_00745 [Flavobacteriaceae bacterium]|nr:hypothetical protein [Flavobacteriaceae bacterium]